MYLVLLVRRHYSGFGGWSIEQIKYPTLRKLNTLLGRKIVNEFACVHVGIYTHKTAGTDK